jgi:hypothetical protein
VARQPLRLGADLSTLLPTGTTNAAGTEFGAERFDGTRGFGPE